VYSSDESDQDDFESGAVADEFDEDEDEFHGDKSRMDKDDLVEFDDTEEEEEDFEAAPVAPVVGEPVLSIAEMMKLYYGSFSQDPALSMLQHVALRLC
jgi:hypothetical protein